MYRITNKLCFATLLGVIGFLFAIPSSAQKAPKGEATVIFADNFSMSGGDCHTSSGGGAYNIVSLIHEGLFRTSPDGRIIPALAKSWELSEDGLILKITLNERAKFHNGEPVTATDVKFSIERAMRPDLKFTWGGPFRRSIDRIEILDDHHLTFFFKLHLPIFFDACANYLGIVPKAYVEKVGDQRVATHPIGAGPFKWIDYEQDVFIEAEAFLDHYRKVPNVKRLHCKCLTEEATIMSMFRAGEADIVPLPLQNFPQVKNDPKLRYVWSKFIYLPTLGFYDLAFPDKPSPFHDVRVRRAASYAINRKVICEKLLHGAAEPWGDILAPYHPGVNPNLRSHPYDPEKAKALLKEAGYPNGLDTTFQFGFLGDRIEAQAIAADLARVGIRAKLVEYEFNTFIRALSEKKHHGIGRRSNPWWAGQTHPGAAVKSCVSSETFWSYSTTPEIEGAYKNLLAAVDEKSIASKARELSRVYRESEIRYPLWAVHQPIGLSERVKSYTPIQGWRTLGGLEFLELKD